jgi:hypothetical protein
MPGNCLKTALTFQRKLTEYESRIERTKSPNLFHGNPFRNVAFINRRSSDFFENLLSLFFRQCRMTPCNLCRSYSHER